MHDKIILIFFTLFIIVSCTKKRKIVVHNCSDIVEAEIDILRSIQLNKKFLNENEIKVEEQSKKCGFTFIYGNKTKYIEGGMTDIDLKSEIKSFYNLK